MISLIVIYFSVNFDKHCHYIVIKRRPEMLRLQFITLWIWTMVQFTIGIGICFTNDQTIWLYVQALLSSIPLLIFVAVTAVRYWLLFFSSASSIHLHYLHLFSPSHGCNVDLKCSDQNEFSFKGRCVALH